MAGSCKGESLGNLPKEDDDDNHGSALVAVSGILEGQRCDLYDSGATHHMTPYRDEFTIFHQMPPKCLTAANQGSFTADGYGDVIISVPNGDRISKIHLRNVLYTPAVGFSLVSISRIDDAGFSATFGGQRCTIYNKNGDIVGSIAKSQNLYRIIRQPTQVGSSNVAKLWTNLRNCLSWNSTVVWGILRPLPPKCLLSMDTWQVSLLSTHWNRFNVKPALKPSRRGGLFRKFDRGSRQRNSGRKSIQISGGRRSTLR
jgi:hypothetical protein